MLSEGSGGKWKELSRITSGTFLSRCDFIQSSVDQGKQVRESEGEREGETMNGEKKLSGAVESASGRQVEENSVDNSLLLDMAKEKGAVVQFEGQPAKQRKAREIGSNEDLDNLVNICNPKIISEVGVSNPVEKVPIFCESHVTKGVTRAVEKEIEVYGVNEVESGSKPFQLNSDVEEEEVKIHSDNVEEPMTEQECEETEQVVYLTPETVPYELSSPSTPVEPNLGRQSTEEVAVGLEVQKTPEVLAVENPKDSKMMEVGEAKAEAKQAEGEEVDPEKGEGVEGGDSTMVQDSTELGTKAILTKQPPSFPANDLRTTENLNHYVQENRSAKSMAGSPTSSPPLSKAILSKSLAPCGNRQIVQTMCEVDITPSDSRHPQMSYPREQNDSELARRETLDSMMQTLKQVSSDLRSNLGKRKSDGISIVDLLDEHEKLAAAMEEVSTLQKCLASSFTGIGASLRKRLEKKERNEREMDALKS